MPSNSMSKSESKHFLLKIYELKIRISVTIAFYSAYHEEVYYKKLFENTVKSKFFQFMRAYVSILFLTPSICILFGAFGLVFLDLLQWIVGINTLFSWMLVTRLF